MKMLTELLATYEEDFEVEITSKTEIEIHLNDNDSIIITGNIDCDDDIEVILMADNFESYPLQIFGIEKAWSLIDTLIYMVTGGCA